MVTTYHNLTSLDNVYLEDSYVYSIDENTDSVVFNTLLVLEKDHPLYTPPKPNKQHCYKKAQIVFSNPESITWEDKNFQPRLDDDGETDIGNIYAFIKRNDGYFVEGDFGSVKIKSSKVDLFFDD